MTDISRAALAAAIVSLLATLAGCGGGGGPGAKDTGPARNLGRVRGEVLYFDNPQLPVTGVEVQVGNTTVTTQNSWFQADVPPGQYEVRVVPPAGFVVASDATAQVSVAGGQTVTLSEPFLLIHESDRPPARPQP